MYTKNRTEQYCLGIYKREAGHESLLIIMLNDTTLKYISEYLFPVWSFGVPDSVDGSDTVMLMMINMMTSTGR